MNAADVLKYGHSWFLKSLADFPDDQWETSGVTGTWSAKDILSHIASYEIVLAPILEEFIKTGRSVNSPIEDHQKFNDEETEKRKDKNYQEVLDEYTKAYEKVMELVVKISPEVMRQTGTLPWYGEEYSLDDYLVYSYYGHKREHGAQIAAFKERLTTSSVSSK